jgi:glutamate dehydrogenase
MPPNRSGAREAGVEAAYMGSIEGSIKSSTAIPSIIDNACAVTRKHLELAEVRSPGAPKLQLYRPGDGSGLGAAVQIVNDDMPMLVDSVTSALRRIGASVVAVIHPVLDVVRDEHGRLVWWPAVTRARLGR